MGIALQIMHGWLKGKAHSTTSNNRSLTNNNNNNNRSKQEP